MRYSTQASAYPESLFPARPEKNHSFAVRGKEGRWPGKMWLDLEQDLVQLGRPNRACIQRLSYPQKAKDSYGSKAWGNFHLFIFRRSKAESKLYTWSPSGNKGCSHFILPVATLIFYTIICYEVCGGGGLMYLKHTWNQNVHLWRKRDHFPERF